MNAAARIDEMVDALGALRWGELTSDRLAWARATATLALALRPGIKLAQLLDAAPADGDDLDIVDALNTVAGLGFRARASRGAPARIDPRLAPCLIRPRGIGGGDATGLRVVLGRDREGRLQVYDCARGVLEALDADDPSLREHADIRTFKRFEPNLEATSSFVRAASGRSWFRALCGRFTSVVGQILIAGLALNLVALSIPLFIMAIYDSVIFSGAKELLPGLAIGAALALVFELALRRVRARGLSWFAARLDFLVGAKIFAQLLALEPAEIERAAVSAQLARIRTFESVRDFFCSGAFLSLLELPFIALSLAAIAIVAGPLVFAPLGFICLYALAFHLLRQRVRVALRLAAKASSARQRLTIETIEKLEAIRVNGLSDLWADKFRQLSGRDALARFRLNQLGQAGEIGGRALSVAAGVVTMATGAMLFWSGAITTGGLVAAMILVWRALGPLSSLLAMAPRLEQLRAAISQINTLMDLPTEAERAPRAAFPSLKGAVSFRGVTLRYAETADPALRELSFTVKPGDLVAVTGVSGAGKSSLLKLVKGLYRASEGGVLIDGFDVRQLDPVELRRQIAYAPQSPAVFTGTVFENMRLAAPTASEADARAALERVGALEAIDALPDGLHTRLDAHGPAAPAPGLAARINLARALMQDARIVLIDEIPNAVMCGPTGAALKRVLAELRGGKTVFVATARTDVIAVADHVVELVPHALGRVRAQERAASSVPPASSRTAAAA